MTHADQTFRREVAHDGYRGPSRLERRHIERHRKEGGLVDVDQVAGAVRRAEIPARCAATNHGLLPAIGQGEHLDGGPVDVARIVGRKQDRPAAGKNLWLHQGQLAVACFREGL